MSSASIQQQLIKEKEKRLAVLMEQYQALSTKMSVELNAANEVSIRQGIKDKETEIENLNQEIENDKITSRPDTRSYDIYHSHWEESLPRIDFKSSKTIVDSVLDKFKKNRESSALLLLQDSASMEGRLCVDYISSCLRQQEIGIWKAPCIAEFQSRQVPSEIDFLNQVAHRFEVQSSDTASHSYTHSVLDKICSSLCSGDVLLIQVGIYYLDAQNMFLEWFVNSFWQALVKQKLSERSQDHPFIRIVGVITVRSRIAKPFLSSELCCKKQAFDSSKILELPLKKWTKTDISDWLFKFSKLTEPQVGLTRSEIEQMASTIYAVTAGTPNLVRNELMREMTQCIG